MIRSMYARARSTAPALVYLSWAQLAFFAVTLALLVLDPRTLGGQPLWMKPAKFAISTAIYGFTLSWMISYLQERARAVKWISGGTAAVMLLEVGLIALQAARGVKSHFNVATPLDGMIFSAMGLGILFAWGLGVWATVLLYRQRFQSPAFGSALWMGLAVSMLGAALGGAMSSPSAPQREAMGRGERPMVSGSHAVGVEDGGAGLPVVGWSTEGGDLRVPHFFGLHAMQALPLAALAVTVLARRRKLTARQERTLVRVTSSTYLALLVALTVQALRAEPVVSPSAFTLVSFGAILFAFVGASAWSLARTDAKPVLPMQPAA